MRSDQSEIYLQKSLETVTGYIRGELNLEEAVQRLQELGHVKKSILKVLKDTDRNNLINIKTKKDLETNTCTKMMKIRKRIKQSASHICYN
jgi:hypothetical protein